MGLDSDNILRLRTLKFVQLYYGRPLLNKEICVCAYEFRFVFEPAVQIFSPNRYTSTGEENVRQCYLSNC